jgi:hypothetical protein
MMATLMKSAPAKVVPIALKNLLFLNVAILSGRLPTIMTMATKRRMNAHLRIARIVVSYILIY